MLTAVAESGSPGEASPAAASAQDRSIARSKILDGEDDYDRSSWASMPIAAWVGVLRDHPDLRVLLADNRTAPLQILAELAQDDDARVRHCVAMKRGCPAVILEELCKDPEAVRSAARRNRVRKPATAGQRFGSKAFRTSTWPARGADTHRSFADGMAKCGASLCG